MMYDDSAIIYYTAILKIIYLYEYIYKYIY